MISMINLSEILRTGILKVDDPEAAVLLHDRMLCGAGCIHLNPAALERAVHA
jgi:hypothetical protein